MLNYDAALLEEKAIGFVLLSLHGGQIDTLKMRNNVRNKVTVVFGSISPYFFLSDPHILHQLIISIDAVDQ